MNPSEMTDDELTNAVAERVMGWHYDAEKKFYLTPDNKWPPLGVDLIGGRLKQEGFIPLHDMNHAWMVVERMIVLGFEPELIYGTGFSTSWRVAFWIRNNDSLERASQVDGEILCRAILEAALEAVEDNQEAPNG